MQGYTAVSAIAQGNTETAINTGKELAKVALVSTLAVGIANVIDGIVDIEDVDEYELVENENTHYVSPHMRTLSDGREIWVDGDGNTAINRSVGWMQSNPAYRLKV